MVGETRDKETLFYLKEAALTWHLCFSTFHANDTLSTLNRLINLLTTDVSQRKLALIEILTFIKWIASQKLVPKLCEHCKIEDSEANIATLLKRKWWDNERISQYVVENRKNNSKYYKTNPDGCAKCNHSWNKWRQVLVEILSFTNPLVADKIKSDQQPEIKRLFEKGLVYVARGAIDLNKLVGEV
jgi:type II secretory ATPase GspE/PulE/Tfp pilus assembly ATPase PilB-like protein